MLVLLGWKVRPLMYYRAINSVTEARSSIRMRFKDQLQGGSVQGADCVSSLCIWTLGHRRWCCAPPVLSHIKHTSHAARFLNFYFIQLNPSVTSPHTAWCQAAPNGPRHQLCSLVVWRVHGIISHYDGCQPNFLQNPDVPRWTPTKL